MTEGRPKAGTDASGNDISHIVKDLPALVPLEQAAAFFHVTTRTFRRWVRGGRIKALRTGSGGSARVLVVREEIARLLASMTQVRPSGP